MSDDHRKYVKFWRRENSTFHAAGRNVLSGAASLRRFTKHISTCMEELRKKKMGSPDSGKLWIENSEANEKSFMAFIFFLQNGKEAEKYSVSSLPCAFHFSKYLC